MADTFTTVLRLRKPEVGANNNTWGDLLNEDLIDLLDSSLAGTANIPVAADPVTLSSADGETGDMRAMSIRFTGTLTANVEVTFDAGGSTYYRKPYLVRNSTDGDFTLTLVSSAGAATIVLPQDDHTYLIYHSPNAGGMRAVRVLSGARLDEAQDWSGAQTSTPVALSDAATVAINLALGNNFTLTAAGNRVLGNPTNPTVGQYFDVLIVGSSATDRTITFDTNYRAPLGAFPTIVVDNTKAALLSFRVAASNRIMLIGSSTDYDLT